MKSYLNLEQVQFDEKGLVPAIIQDAKTKDVLTLAYMNKESLAITIEQGETWFYSRSRKSLWHKGETSGNKQKVVSLHYDCDQDVILVQVEPMGPACHTGKYSCFHGIEKGDSDRLQIITKLEQRIKERDVKRPEGTYTTYLFEKGMDKILKKVGEEAAEVIIAAKNQSHSELCYETADLIYHLLVLLQEAKLPLDRVLNELESRYKESLTSTS
ncbi:bifunctional phosphoribosyl-AMP cyclohydrolase/phosphoribosyl-ATP diphosphatase HisIE [Thermoflavimicrobium daqui]|uniref:Histidine biosynthesis bifunctional protein HisIE n=1 Tax=Thermoflavimicrobium daqui TaxID=2137476 RepID=A0A364K534_9BACL|nr:bifunctional phosphoribosyl-AMP cyclohydrolase/phosphoribosyl-ATP diphosphatase HisIE [Thermoflavimicrobium daqui]RAL24498.1 bifunctional phosphoribosyl-AMP cyclohydrolase/phosphoribosyl-ATP pyrophosphatase [Thermoflavimicrobium daqui]